MRAIPFSIPSSQDSIVTEEDHMPFFYNYLHLHKEIQITRILKGEGTLVVDNFSQSFYEGDTFIIGSNKPHIFKSSQSHFAEIIKDRIHAFHIYFDAENFLQLNKLPELGAISSFLQRVKSGYQVPANAMDAAGRIIEKIQYATGLRKLISFIELMEYFSETSHDWKSLSSGAAEIVSADMGGRMNLIYDFTIKHYSENISLEKIAQVCFMTPQAFCKYFKKHTSKTYITFLQEIRVKEACKKIMREDFDSISTVGYACGFNSPINFHKVFKKYTGVAPSAYIRRHRVTDDRMSELLAS